MASERSEREEKDQSFRQLTRPPGGARPASVPLPMRSNLFQPDGSPCEYTPPRGYQRLPQSWQHNRPPHLSRLPFLFTVPPPDYPTSPSSPLIRMPSKTARKGRHIKAGRIRPLLITTLFYSGCVVSMPPSDARVPEKASPLRQDQAPGPGERPGDAPHSQPPCGLVSGATYAYLIGPAPLDCPNWYASLRKARLVAGCDGSGRGDPANACQIKLKECSACDVCQILQPGQGPEVTIRRMGRNGWTATDYSRVDFREELCTDFRLIGELAATMLHEATHACPSVDGGTIRDLSPETARGLGPPLVPLSPKGCNAYDITSACLGQ